MAVDPKNPGQRARAFRLRKRVSHGEALDPIDRLWLDEYNHSDTRRRQANGEPPPPDVGASRKSRKISLDIDEAAESVGTGDAATAGAMAAAVGALREREEGRRLDSLTIQSTDVLKEACAVYKDMCLMLKDQVELMMSAVTESMVSARTHYLAAAQMEAQLMAAQNAENGNPADALMLAFMAKQMGIDPGVLKSGVAAAQQQQQQQQGKGKPPPPGPNGVAS